MDLFKANNILLKVVSVPIEERIEQAINAIQQLFARGVVPCVAFSGGKDSTALLMLAIMAAERAVEAGLKPILWVLNTDTGVESPVVWHHARSELHKASVFAEERGITMKIGVSKPSMSSSWILRIVGGRALPSFPENNTDCSVEWKVQPMQKLRRKLEKHLAKELKTESCTLIGTRFSESQDRARKMNARGESAIEPVRNKAEELVLAPIAMWSDDDVWEMLALVRYGQIKSYTDTETLFAIYQDAGPTSCAVVNDSILTGAASSRGGCGARTGCWTCVKVRTDASMENFLRKPEYAFMQGLNDLREFISATQYDLSRRQWCGRTINHGYIAVRPDAYSPGMIRELFQYVLSLQATENEIASNTGKAPRFTIINLRDVIAVDALWSLNGFHTPFTAIKDFHDVFEKGVRYTIPKVEAFPKVEMPEPRFLYVGEDWVNASDRHLTGLRNPLGEAMTELHPCMNTRTLKDGRLILDVNTDVEFTVDEESAYIAMEFEIDHLLEMHEKMRHRSANAFGYKWWLQYGTIALAKMQVGIHDGILRRTEFKARHGIAGPEQDLRRLEMMSVPWFEAPVEVQEAFIEKNVLSEYQARRKEAAFLEKQMALFA